MPEVNEETRRAIAEAMGNVGAAVDLLAQGRWPSELVEKARDLRARLADLLARLDAETEKK